MLCFLIFYELLQQVVAMAEPRIWQCFAIVFVVQVVFFAPCIPASEDAERIVLVSTTSNIYISRGAELDFSILPIADVGRPIGLDFDANINMLFWTDSTGRCLLRADLDATDWTYVTSTDTNPNEVAVDGNEQLIFWTSSRYNNAKLSRVTYDGKDKREIRTHYNPMYSVTLDRNSRTIYWTEGDYLRKSSYDGSNYVNLANANTPNSRLDALSLQSDGSTVYRCDDSSLKSLDLTEADSDLISIRDLSSRCKATAWFEEDLYWIVGSTLSIRDGRFRIVRDISVASSLTDLYVGRTIVPGLDGGKCDFEGIQCHWAFKNSKTDNLQWSRFSARNSSKFPARDHTAGPTGHYAIVNQEASGGTASFASPLITASLTNQKCFRFWYHMHAITNGSLKVFFEQDQTETRSSKLIPIWSTEGSTLNEWIGAEIEVRASGNGRILIQAVVGDPNSNIIAIDDVEYGECRQDSRLECGDTSMTVYLDKARLGISNQDGVSFKGSECRGAEYDGNTVKMTTQYDGCNTRVRESDDVIVFSNEVNVAVRSGIRSSNMSIRVNCSFNRAYHVGMTYLAHAWIKHINEDGYGNFSVSIRQYGNSNFEDVLSTSMFPQQVEEDDIIYMATEMVTVGNIVDTLHNARCWVTPSPSPADPLNTDIIQDGCPVGNGSQVYTMTRDGMQPFSFEALSFRIGVNLMYVHCDIIICHDLEGSSCTSDCNHSSLSRETRSARDAGSGPYTVSQGPFIYKLDASRHGGAASMKSILLSALICMTVLLLAVILVGAFIYARFKKEEIRHV